MSRDAGSTRQNKRLEQLNKLREEGDDKALQALMAANDGRRVLTRLARDFGWMGEVYDPNSDRQTAFNAGQQGAAVKLMKWAERVAPEEFLTAIGEATQRDVDMNVLAKAATQKDENDDD